MAGIGLGLALVLNATNASPAGSTASEPRGHGWAAAASRPHETVPGPAALVRMMQDAGIALSPTDEAQYRQAFAAQASDAPAPVVKDTRLMGHVLADRYLYAASAGTDFGALQDWLKAYGDLPQAIAIYHAAQHRRPLGETIAFHPKADTSVGPALTGHLPGIANLSHMKLAGHYDLGDRAHVDHLVGEVLAHLRDDAVLTAAHVFQTSDAAAYLDPDDYAALEARVAAGLLYDGQNRAAFDMASESLGSAVSQDARWTAGLAAFHLKKFDVAETHFAAIAGGADNALATAAASFWAGRAALRAGHAAAAESWLRNAVAEGPSFYGLLAARILRIDRALGTPAEGVLGTQDLKLIAAEPGGARGLLLLQLGLGDRAEAELQALETASRPELKASLRRLADEAHLSDLGARIDGGTAPYDAGSFPIPHWTPHGGYTIDPALVYAIARQESRFDPDAESSVGAIGLMQIMPRTATEIAARKDNGPKENWDEALFDPETNLELGQRYVQSLLGRPEIGNNLIMMAVAYNGGPANLSRWRRANGETDPLLFLESVPAAETRGFIEQVLANYWVYRSRLHKDNATLDQLAAGNWPTYPGTEIAVADARQ